jgi:hypothetical protein
MHEDPAASGTTKNNLGQTADSSVSVREPAAIGLTSRHGLPVGHQWPTDEPHQLPHPIGASEQRSLISGMADVFETIRRWHDFFPMCPLAI